MAEVASAYVSLLPSARGFGRQLESEVGGEVDSAGVSLGHRLGAGLGKAAAAAAATLGAVAIAAGSIGIKTAAQLEQAEIGFTTMLGSGEKAKAFLTDLSTFAGKTPFEFPELQTAASSLVSAGVAADKVIPIMTSLGNATSGMGTGAEGVQRATVALQQMNAAGKITGEDLNQLRDAGIPVYDLLAAATGKSVEAVAELAQKGKLGREELEQLMTALETGQGLERFTGLMEAQSASLNGMWSTLKDTFSMGMADAIQPLVPLIKDGLGGATAFVTAQMPALKLGLADVVTGVQSFVAGLNMQGPIDGFSGRLNTLGLGLRALRDAFRDPDVTSDGFVGFMEQAGSSARAMYDSLSTGLVPALRDTGAAIAAFFSDPGNRAELGASFSSVGESVGALVPVVQTFLTQMPSLTDFVSVGATALGFLADHADLLVKAMPLLVGAVIAFKVAQLASNVAMAASPVIRLLEVGATRAQAAAIRDLVAAQKGAVATQVATNAVTATGAAATNVGTAASIRQRVATLAGAVAQKAAALGTGIATAAQWAWNAALTANPIGIVVVAIGALVAALVWFFTQTEVGQKIVQVAWAGIKAAVQNTIEFLSPYIQAAVLLWKTIFTTVFNAIKGVVSDVIGGVRNVIQGGMNIVRGIFSGNLDQILAGVRQVLGGVLTVFTALPRNILGALGDLGGILLGAGKNIMQGFLEGLRKGFDAVKDFVGGIGSWIADHKGPKAYDLALLKPAGGWIMTGLRTSLEAEIPALKDTLSKVTGAIEVGNVQKSNLNNLAVGATNGAVASKREMTLNAYNYERPLTRTDVVAAFRSLEVLDGDW